MASLPKVTRVMTRKIWNQDIIKKINGLTDANPECVGDVEPLEEVGENHVWTFKDIEDVQARLSSLCNDSEFTSPYEYWSAKIVQEIEDAIKRGACGCCDWVINYTWTDVNGESDYGSISITSDGDVEVHVGEPSGELGSPYGGYSYIQSGPTSCSITSLPPVGGGEGGVFRTGDCGACEPDTDDLNNLVKTAWPPENPYDPPTIGEGGALDPLHPRGQQDS
jgi:hypothetical protein